MAAEAFVNPLLVPYIVTFSLSMDFESGFFFLFACPVRKWQTLNNLFRKSLWLIEREHTTCTILQR
jgi:hypothetical protein